MQLARDELQTTMVAETNRKRRRLERDRRATERPQPGTFIQARPPNIRTTLTLEQYFAFPIIRTRPPFLQLFMRPSIKPPTVHRLLVVAAKIYRRHYVHTPPFLRYLRTKLRMTSTTSSITDGRPSLHRHATIRLRRRRIPGRGSYSTCPRTGVLRRQHLRPGDGICPAARACSVN